MSLLRVFTAILCAVCLSSQARAAQAVPAEPVAAPPQVDREAQPAVIGGVAAVRVRLTSGTITGPSSTARNLNFQSSDTERWVLSESFDPETGRNTGSSLLIGAYDDSGSVYLGTALQASRASGPFGLGSPFFSSFAATNFTGTQATFPAGVSGNSATWSDIQPTSVLTNAVSTLATSSEVTISWIGNNLTPAQGWVKLSPLTCNGLSLAGWYPLISATPLAVTLAAGAKATSTGPCAGRVSVTPGFVTQGEKVFMQDTSGAAGFETARTTVLFDDPLYFDQSGGFSPQGHWEIHVCPLDTTHQWSCVNGEADVVNRGNDEGWYQDDQAGGRQLTGGRLYVPEASPYDPTGGYGHNATFAVAIAPSGEPGNSNPSGHNASFYKGFENLPGALVPAAHDPHNHGGVFLQPAGGYSAGVTLSTLDGSSTVAVRLPQYVSVLASTPVIFRGCAAVGGLTLSGQYAITSVRTSSTNTITVSAGSTAASTATGGGSSCVAEVGSEAPYAPLQAYGYWTTGEDWTAADLEDNDVQNYAAGQFLAWRGASGSTSTFGVTEEGAVQSGHLDLHGGGPLTVNGAVIAAKFMRPGSTTYDAISKADPAPLVGDQLVISDAAACAANTPITAGGGTAHACLAAYNGDGWIAVISH